MVQFGKQLLYHQVDQWSDYYIDYKKLKGLAKYAAGGVDLQHTFELGCGQELNKVAGFYEEKLSALCEQYVMIVNFNQTSGGTGTASSGGELTSGIEGKRGSRSSMSRAIVDLWRHIQFLRNFCILNYTGFVKITKKFKKIIGSGDISAGIMSRVNGTSLHKHMKLLELNDQLRTLFARRFFGGDLTFADATLRLKQQPASDWHQFQTGLHCGVLIMLLCWTAWASRLMTSTAKPRLGETHVTWSHPAVPLYRFMFCALLVEWSWGCMLFVWSRYRINYFFIMGLRPVFQGATHSQGVLESAANGTIVLLVNFLVFVKLVEAELPVPYLPEGIVAVAALPYLIYHLAVPAAWLKALLPPLSALVYAPLVEITFISTFIGDWFVSLVRVWVDMLYTACYIGTGAFLEVQNVESQAHLVSVCVNNKWYQRCALPLVLVLPLWFRMMQNLRRYYDTRQRWPHLGNALKYALSHAVVIFGFCHHYSGPVDNHYDYKTLWVGAFLGSTLYSYIWDLTMDWGLLKQADMLRDRRMFPSKLFYYSAFGLNLVGRFIWTSTLIPTFGRGPFQSSHLAMSLSEYFGVLEIGRRCFWSLLRLENEHLNDTYGYRRVKMVPMHFDSARKPESRKPISSAIIACELACLLAAVAGFSVLSFMTTSTP